jgi:triphosphatase
VEPLQPAASAPVRARFRSGPPIRYGHDITRKRHRRNGSKQAFARFILIAGQKDDMASDLEVELKLETGAAEIKALATASLLSGAKLESREQVSTYFDTPDRDLRAQGLSLRVRRSGGRYIQTIKADGTSSAGLFARPEWESEIAGASPEPHDAVSPLPTLLPEEVLQSLTPVFTVEVTRRLGRLQHDGGEIEVALDHGRILAGDRSTPLDEVELELKGGNAAALFAFARALDAVVPLRVGVLAKSEQGYNLVDSAGAKSIKAEAPVMSEDVTLAAAFQAIAGASLRHFRLNEAILQQARTPEALHQARVALRRMRSALSIFKPMLEDDRFERIRTDLRWLAATLGDARDIDVLLGRPEYAGMEPLRLAREQAYADVEAALSSSRTRTLMIDLSEWIAIGAWRTVPSNAALRDGPAERFAVKTLERLRRRVKQRGRDLLHLSDEERHEVRILSKKLRYASEFFLPLFDGKKAKRRSKAFLKALEALQQHLGDLNDIAHGPSVLSRLGIEVRNHGDVAKRRDALLVEAADAHPEFADTKPFWR